MVGRHGLLPRVTTLSLPAVFLRALIYSFCRGSRRRARKEGGNHRPIVATTRRQAYAILAFSLGASFR